MANNVVLTGPLFRSGAGEKARAAGEAVIRELAELGVQRLAETVPVKTGHYRRNIHNTISGLNGSIDDSGVIYGPWLEGVSSRNQTTRFKGYANFRKAAQWLSDVKAVEVTAKHGEQLARELNG